MQGGLPRPWCAATLAIAILAPMSAGGQTTPVARVLGGLGFNEIYGAGLGASGGVEFPFIRGRPFFVGARGIYHFGKDGELPALTTEGGEVPVGTLRQLHYGIEIGTTWMQSPVLLRTVGGIGVARFKATIDQGESSVTGWRNELQYGPGLLLALIRDGGAFFGLEARFVKVLDVEDSFAIYGTLGKKWF